MAGPVQAELETSYAGEQSCHFHVQRFLNALSDTGAHELTRIALAFNRRKNTLFEAPATPAIPGPVAAIVYSIDGVAFGYT